MNKSEKAHFAEKLGELKQKARDFALRYRAQRSGAYKDVDNAIQELIDYVDAGKELQEEAGTETDDDSENA